MKLHHRAMKPSDMGECIGLLADHPAISSRFGSLIQHLPELWLKLLNCGAGSASVIFADEGPCSQLCFAGVTAIVSDQFLQEMKTAPHFWIGPELTRRIIAGNSPLLNNKQLREANSQSGLNLVCLENCLHAGYAANGQFQRYMMSVFIQEHRGFLWNEVIANQPESAERLRFLVNTGAMIWDAVANSYSATLREDPAAVVGKPHIVGITRELEQNRQDGWAGSWVGALFDYHAPIMGFNRSEQRLLSCALLGATDEYLAPSLGTSLSTVKKMWVSIYERVSERLPGLTTDPEHGGATLVSRGREKRRYLLSYLREHPEELRPYSRKLLPQTGNSQVDGFTYKGLVDGA